MRKSIVAVSVMLLLLLVLEPRTVATTHTVLEYVPGEVVVGFIDEIKPDVSDTIAQIQSVRVRVPVGAEEWFINKALQHPKVKYVERNSYVKAFYVPSDPGYSFQWHYPAIHAPEAWNITKGSANVTVAVVDTGVDLDHPDLDSRIWTNSGEIPDNGIDDDGNGYVDDWVGWNFAYGTNDPMDDNRHGTHVAGIVSAEMDNGLGGAGLAPNVKIMAVKVLAWDGYGTIWDIANGSSTLLITVLRLLILV